MEAVLNSIVKAQNAEVIRAISDKHSLDVTYMLHKYNTPTVCSIARSTKHTYDVIYPDKDK